MDEKFALAAKFGSTTSSIGISSAIFAQHIHVTDTQTDRQTCRPRYVQHLQQQAASMQ